MSLIGAIEKGKGTYGKVLAKDLANNNWIAIKILEPKHYLTLRTGIYQILREVEILELMRKDRVEAITSPKIPINTAYLRGCEYTK